MSFIDVISGAKGWRDHMAGWTVVGYDWDWNGRKLYVGLKEPGENGWTANLELGGRSGVVARDRLRGLGLFACGSGVSLLSAPAGTLPAWREEAE